MVGDYIFYIGENRDFSDRWLARIAQEQTRLPVIFLELGKENNKISHPPVLVINRLYASAIYRCGKENVMRAFRKLIALEKTGASIVNSSEGYLIELDRTKQFTFFNKHQITEECSLFTTYQRYGTVRLGESQSFTFTKFYLLIFYTLFL